MMGAEAIKELLKRVEVETLSTELREKMKNESFAAEEAQVSRSASKLSRHSARSGTSRTG